MTVSPSPIPMSGPSSVPPWPPRRQPPPLPSDKPPEPPPPAAVQVCWALGLTSVLFTGVLTGLPAVVLGHWLLHAPRGGDSPALPLSPGARKRVKAGLLMGYGGIALTVVLGVLIYILIVLWRRVGDMGLW